MNIRGTALPNSDVLLRVKQVTGPGQGEVAAAKVQADDRGNWEFTFNESLGSGRYILTAQSQDERGALSLVVESSQVQIKSKPIIQIGIIQLGKGGAALFLFILLTAGMGLGAWFYRKRQAKIALRVGFAEAEITKIFKLIAVNVDELSKAPPGGEYDYALARLRQNVVKMESYLQKGIERIKNK